MEDWLEAIELLKKKAVAIKRSIETGVPLEKDQPICDESADKGYRCKNCGHNEFYTKLTNVRQYYDGNGNPTGYWIDDVSESKYAYCVKCHTKVLLKTIKGEK